ncbi:MAG TPA: hypothetical protein DDW81_03210 [Cryomorphaceae bacterium]|nr:hypothetical protein [Owenweeksia sp.]HBF19078.1 hypothetical protein [Cryomorphaceae bacterium]HCQ14770.1 hypothetical protein [Cryomorphaceae bacterium]|tara:strand:+ start:557 stop:1417 length:861 start_codon:yes stop_codon:yes gene_type:complete
MKKLVYIWSLCLATTGLFAQVSTIPAEDINPEESLKIIVDLTQMDGSKDYIKNLQDDAASGKDIYMWTWSPYEFPAGHPKANGTGAQAWKSSNELLKMTKEGPGVYSYTLIPTEFYEVDAATVYNNDISFLVKPKDGGGYGDPDRKSDDLKVTIDPPNTERPSFYSFPAFSTTDDLMTLVYENARDTTPTMQNLDPDDCYFYPQITLSDSTTFLLEPSIFNAGNNPKLKMDYVGDNTFRKQLQPRDFFNVPPGKTIIQFKAAIIRKQYLSAADRSTSAIDMSMLCP